MNATCGVRALRAQAAPSSQFPGRGGARAGAGLPHAPALHRRRAAMAEGMRTLSRAAFVESLADLRFTGDIDAMAEGTVFFADEPILRIVAPLREAQLVESRVMNLIHYQTVVASKAARSVLAAPTGCSSISACGARTARRRRSCRRGRAISPVLPGRRPSKPAVEFGIPAVRNDGALVRAGACRRKRRPSIPSCGRTPTMPCC